MNHEILQYGNNCHMSNVEMSIPCSQSNHLSTSTHTLRQWRKKDVLLGTSAASNSSSSQQTPSPTQQQPSSPAPTTHHGQQQLRHHTAGTAAAAAASAPNVHMADTGQTQGGQIARVAPHNHYPRGTAGTTQQPPPIDQHQQYVPTSSVVGGQSAAAVAVAHAAAAAAAAAAASVHQHHQYGGVAPHQMYGGGSGHPHPTAADYSYTPYKDPTSTLQHLHISQHQLPQQPTPVKYSEIVEPSINQNIHHSTSSLLNKPHQQQSTKEQLLASTKDYHQSEMCSGSISAMQQGQHHQMVPSNQQQQYNSAMMKHPQYLPQPPPHHLGQYYKHATPMHQYHQRYTTETNNYLADLNKIAPQMAQSIMNDPHLRDPNQMYPPPSQSMFEAQRGSTYAGASFQQQQQQRLYGRPSSNSTYHHQKPPTSMYPPTSHLPRGYPVKSPTSTVDNPYRNMSLYQPHSVAKYPAQPEYSKQLHLMDLNRRPYPDNMHQLNYGLSPKMTSASYSQCAQQQIDYAHHYQQSRHHAVASIPSEYQQMSVRNPYLQPDQHPQLHMPDLVRDNTPKSTNSLKQYLESWNDEDLGGTTEDSGIVTSSGSLDLIDKPLIKVARPGEMNENIYVLDSTDIPTETVSQFLQHVPQIDKLPDNIKFYPEIGKINDKYSQFGINSMEGILNLTSNFIKCNSSSEYSPPACLRAEEPPLNIRSVLDETNNNNKPHQTFLSLPVIEDDEPAVRSNLRMEDPVLACTSAIEEDSEVVPAATRSDCLQLIPPPEKCSPALGFVDCSLSGGSVIVPNIGLTQKIDLVPKKGDVESSCQESERFKHFNMSSGCFAIVPKNDLSAVESSSPTRSDDGDGDGDGETLDLSVGDVSAAPVEDKVVPVVQEIEDNSVINLASQNDKTVKSDDGSELAMNLSRQGSTEHMGSGDEETGSSTTTEKDVVGQGVKRVDYYEKLQRIGRTEDPELVEGQLVEGNKEITTSVDEESTNSSKDFDETSQHEVIKPLLAAEPFIVQDYSLHVQEVSLSESEAVLIGALKDSDGDIKHQAPECIMSEASDLLIKEAKLEIEEYSVYNKQEVYNLKVEDLSMDNCENREEKQLDPTEDDGVTDDEGVLDARDLEEATDEEFCITDLSIGKRNVKLDKSAEDVDEVICKSPNLAEDLMKEDDSNKEDLLDVTLKEHDVEEIPKQEADLSDNCNKTEDVATGCVREIKSSEANDDFEESKCGVHVPEEIIPQCSEEAANVIAKTPIAVEEDNLVKSKERNELDGPKECCLENVEENEEIEAVNPPAANNEENRELDNEMNEGLNIIRILQNNVILQIADELVQINVINTNERKMISVIALSDCTVVTENNNNPEQFNVEEEMQVHEDLVPEEVDGTRANVVSDEVRSDEHSVDGVEPELNENVVVKKDETVQVNLDASESLKKEGVANCRVEDLPMKDNFISVEEPQDGTSLKIKDSVLDNLETMLEADIDFAEDVNIQTEVIIGQEESQESISEEILLMTCKANEQQQEEVHTIGTNNEMDQQMSAAGDVERSLLDDSVDDGQIKENGSGIIVLEQSESIIEVLKPIELQIEDEMSKVEEKTSTGIVERDFIKADLQEISLNDKELSMENTNCLDQAEDVKSSCKEPVVVNKDSTSNDRSILSTHNEPVEGDLCKCEEVSTLKESRKIVTKASLKLIAENNLDVDVKQIFDKKDGFDEMPQINEEELSPKSKENLYVKSNTVAVVNCASKKVESPKIVLKAIKRKLSRSNDNLDLDEDQFADGKATPTVLATESWDEKECSKKNFKVSKNEDSARMSDRPKIPGVDKLKTKFIIPKKNNSSNAKPVNSGSKSTKPKLVSFSTIVDEIKDRAKAARDRKSLPTSDKLTKILKQSTNVALKKPATNKKRDARCLSESQPKNPPQEATYSIASESKNVPSQKKAAQPKKTASNESLVESPNVELNTKKNVDKKGPKGVGAIEEFNPKLERKIEKQKPLETIIAKISRDAKKVASSLKLKLDSPNARPRDDPSPIQKKHHNAKTTAESLKIPTQEDFNISGEVSSSNKNSKAPIKTSVTGDSPKSDSELIFKKESHSPKKYTKVKIFKSRLNSFDSGGDVVGPEIKVKTKAELKEAIHLDINDEPAVLHIESIISEKICQESKEKFLNASPPTVLADLLSPLNVNRDIDNARNKEVLIEKDKNTSKEDKEDDTNRRRLSLKEYNNRKRKVSRCMDSPLFMDSSVDSPLQNLNPEPPEDDLPPPAKLPSIDSAAHPSPSSFVSRMETSPKAEDMNLAAPSITPIDLPKPINTPQSVISYSNSAADVLETIELQLMNSRTPNRSIEDEKELIAKKLEDLLVTIPIAQKSDNLIKRFLNREQLSPEEEVKVKEIIEFKRAKEEFLKESHTSSIMSGLGIKPLGSYRRLNFDIASDISIPIQINDDKHFTGVQDVVEAPKSKENFVARSLNSYKKLNFDIASDISIPCSTSKTSESFDIEKLPQHRKVPTPAMKSQPIDCEPVFKRLQAELLNSSTKSINSVNKAAIGINKDKRSSKPTAKINRPSTDSATTPKVLIKPSFLCSSSADGKDLLQDNGDSVYEISSSSIANENSRNSNRRNSSPTDELKIHLRKVQQQPSSSIESLTSPRKRKKKRFRNLYSADTESSDETTTSSTSTGNSPAVRMAGTTSCTTDENGGYSIICSGTFSGLPKIIIKRTNSDSMNCNNNKGTPTTVLTDESQSGDLGMQPVVRLVRNPRLDNLAKRKRKG